MRSWLNWVKNGGISTTNNNPVKMLGRLILSIWILIIAVVGTIGFVASALESKPKDSSTTCVPVNSPNTDLTNSCDVLTP